MRRRRTWQDCVAILEPGCDVSRSESSVSSIAVVRILSEKPYKREGQEKTLSFGSMPIFLGIEPNRLKEWSSSGDKVVVAACEAEKQFFLPVVPFRCCDGTHRF